MRLCSLLLAFLLPLLLLYTETMNGIHPGQTLVDRSAVSFCNDDLSQPNTANLSKSDDTSRKPIFRSSLLESLQFHTISSWHSIDDREYPIRVITAGTTTTRRL